LDGVIRPLIVGKNPFDVEYRHKQAGCTAFKFRPGGAFESFGSIKEFIPYLRKIRAAVGPDFDLIQEANTRWTMDQCMEIAPVLEELKFTWFKEPTRRVIDDYVKLKQFLPTVKIFGGEGLATRAALVDWMDRGAYDIVQPGCDDAAVSGYIDVPQKPGLGVELKEGLAELSPPIPGNWNMPDPYMPPGEL